MIAQVPVIQRADGNWFVLSSFSKKGIVRAVKINKRKNQVLDWDGHHCDEAVIETSIRICPRGWQVP